MSKGFDILMPELILRRLLKNGPLCGPGME